MQTILVTGAGGALGTALAKSLAGRGSRVAALGSPRSSEALAALAKELGERGACFAADLASAEGWRDALAALTPKLGPITGAVFAAGAWKGGAPFPQGGDAVWKAMMEANLETARRGLEALLPGMRERRAGSIVVIGSRAAERPWESANAAAYAASKAAVVALAQACAAEVLDAGVRVNAILPSTIDTAANRSAMPGSDPARWVSTESIADVAAFLLSEAARDVSGAAIPVYGRA